MSRLYKQKFIMKNQTYNIATTGHQEGPFKPGWLVFTGTEFM